MADLEADRIADYVAVFNDQDHAIAGGWATYQKMPARPHRTFMYRWSLRCRLGRHAWPAFAPDPPNGYSPSNYVRCQRCQAWLHWYVLGQHRWGGMDAHSDGFESGSDG